MSIVNEAEAKAQKTQKSQLTESGLRLTVLQEVSQLIVQEERTENIVQAVFRHLIETLGYHAVEIYRLSPAGKDLWLYLELGSGNKPVTQNINIFSVEEENIVSHAVRKDKPVYVEDIRRGPYSYHVQSESKPTTLSELTLPLKCGSTTLGALRIQSARVGDFEEKTIDFLNSVANLLAHSIKTEQTVQNLQDNLQEVSILYNLQRKEELSKHLRSDQRPIPLAYQYDKESVSNIDSENLPPSVDSKITQGERGISITQNEQSRELVAPLKLYGETIGIIGVEDSAEGEEWSVDDINLLEEVSSQVALAIENSRLLQQTQKRTNELSLLFETSRQLSETVNLHQIYDIIATEIINYLNADYCAVSLLNKARTHFVIIIEKQIDENQGRLVIATVTDNPHPESIEDSLLLQKMLKSPGVVTKHAENSDPQFQAVVIFPLLVRNSLIGVLKVGYKKEPASYTKNEQQLAQAIISQGTVAIENAQLFEQTQNALTETQKLYELSRSLVESTTLEETFEVVLGNVRAFNVDRVSVSLLERDQAGKIDNVKIVASWDGESDQILPVGTTISSQMFSLVEAFAQPPFAPMISEDLSQPENQDKRMDEAFRQFMYRGLGAITMFSTPMFLGSDYKGVLSISTRSPHSYLPQEIRIYQTLADQAIIAIERHRLLETTRRERDRAALLFEFGQKLSQTVTINDIKQTVLDFTGRLGATHGEIFIVDDKEFFTMDSTIPEHQSMSPQETEIFIKAALSTGIEAEAFRARKTTLRIKQGSDDWSANHHPEGWIQSIIATPFHSRRSDLRGVLTLFSDMEDTFTEEHFSMLESMAIQISATLENIWLLQQTAVVLSETELLYKATRDFNSAQQFEDLLATLTESFVSPGVQTKIDLSHISIALISAQEVDGTPKSLNIVASWNGVVGQARTEISLDGYPIITTPNQKISSDDYPFIRQLSPDSPYRIESADSETVAEYLEKHFGKARVALSIPLRVGKNWLGVLFVASQTDTFNLKLNAVNRISTLAGQVAVVIQNLQLVEETQQNLFNSEILSHLSQELLVTDSQKEICDLSLNAIAATEPSRGAAIFMYDQIEGAVELEMVAIWNNPGQEWPPVAPGIRFSTQELGLVPLLKTGQTISSDDVQTDQRFSEPLQQLLTMMEIRSLGAVPIWLQKEVNGFILIGNKEPGLFAPDNLRLYENIGRLISGAMENLRLFEQAEYRATQLQTAAEVSQVATGYLDLDTLLSRSVDLIRERFRFYHVSIFLVDEYQKYAIIEASTGEIGQKMLASKHKLAVGGKSIVGTATGTGKPRIALDVGQDAVHFNNPLLPDTRSEMALPLIARGRVIGALDVQSIKRSAFTKSDITILESMANQLANAIEAARSYRQARQALEEVSKVQEHYLRDEWGTFLRNQKAITGYRLTEQGFIAQDDTISQSEEHKTIVNRVIEAKHPILLPASPEREKTTEQEVDNGGLDHSNSDSTVANEPPVSATLAAPLSLHGHVAIGAVDFEISDATVANDEYVLSIIETVASQAAQAIEAARLFEETQASREEAEALYEVGRALVTAESQQEMFHTVLREMLSTLGLKQGGILFFEKDRKFGKLHALFIDGKPVPPDLRIPVEKNPSYRKLIKTKLPVSIADFSTDPLVAPVRKINPDHKIASLLLVPIIIDDEVIGALGADSVNQKHVFTGREINLVIAMADQLAIMLQNRSLLEETRRRAIQLQTSSDVGRVATSILDQDPLLERAVDLIRDRFGFYHVQVFLTDESGKYAFLQRSSGAGDKKLAGSDHRVRIGEPSVIGQAAYQRHPIVIRDTESDESDLTRHYRELLPEARAELAIPLQVGNILIGVLDVHSVSVNDFTEEDIDTLETLAAQIAIAIQNARAFREQQETAERLKEVDKLKTQFLANMSHELRTPLNSIIGFSRVILKGIDGPLTELQKTDLTAIYNSGQHLLGLINNVLDLSKIEAGKMELNFEEVEVAPIIKGVMSTAIALVKDKSVKLTQEVPEGLPTVWADPTRLRQIILNLVSNACKFTDEGSVVLRVNAKREKIIFSVSDTGIGINTDKLESIFEEFIQVDASTTRKVGGTGLGLPISRHFVELHKGQIWVDSTPGKGSTFSFAIPIKTAAESSGPEDSIGATDAKEGQDRTILAVDDDPGVINLYKRFLEKRNYKIIGVNRAKNVFEETKRYSPDAILLDIVMPDKDGLSLLKELKQDPFTKDIPVIICSIKSETTRGLALGAVDYLTKPIVEGELVNALQNLSDQKDAQLKVLVIDDQVDDILLIRRILEAHNYHILEASSGNAGLDLATRRLPDLVILDLKMPDMDGFGVIEALGKDHQTASIPIIVVSAMELTQQEHKFLINRVKSVVRKGFTDADLLREVSKVFENRQASVESW